MIMETMELPPENTRKMKNEWNQSREHRLKEEGASKVDKVKS